MEVLELYADGDGETHFRRVEVDFTMRDFAPPSLPIGISKETPVSTALFLSAPPGWDDSFHPTPRRQYAVALEGEASVTATDGETVRIRPGDVLLLNDANSKGHLTRVTGDRDARFMMIGLE